MLIDFDQKKILEEELKKQAKLKLKTDSEEDDTEAESDDEDDDQNFIKKDDKEEQQENEEKKDVKKGSEVKGVINKLKNLIFPKSTQLRDLSRETGGLEVEKDKGVSEKDVWDDRSEQVDKMGSTDTFNTTGMRSVVWKKKRERLQAAKEMAKDAVAAAAIKKGHRKSEATGLGIGQVAPQQSYVERLKNLRQDHSHEGGNDKGGAWR